ncbi:hypothetical protein [Aerosakkonema funiforme]|uniref:hypothetical protein n=1 Tax=Aerosakkonema funiforme TaxID=1246630 RepID=UPI0035B90DDE
MSKKDSSCILNTTRLNEKLVILEKLANKFSQKILFESRRRKIQIFLCLPQLNVQKIWWPIFSACLTKQFEPKEVLYIAIDRTFRGMY